MNVQFKKGVIELLVLILLNNKDEYGYSLIKKITEKVLISEGTVYPILRRLVKEEVLSTYYKESLEGPARKYYHLTENGKKEFQSLMNEWNEFTLIIDNFIEENLNNE